MERGLAEREPGDGGVPQFVGTLRNAVSEGAKARFVLTAEQALQGCEHAASSSLSSPRIEGDANFFSCAALRSLQCAPSPASSLIPPAAACSRESEWFLYSCRIWPVRLDGYR